MEGSISPRALPSGTLTSLTEMLQFDIAVNNNVIAQDPRGNSRGGAAAELYSTALISA